MEENERNRAREQPRKSSRSGSSGTAGVDSKGALFGLATQGGEEGVGGGGGLSLVGTRAAGMPIAGGVSARIRSHRAAVAAASAAAATAPEDTSFEVPRVGGAPSVQLRMARWERALRWLVQALTGGRVGGFLIDLGGGSSVWFQSLCSSETASLQGHGIDATIGRARKKIRWSDGGADSDCGPRRG